MRKITSLMMLLCMFVATAWAGPTDLPQITTDLNNPIYYTIYNTRSSQPGGLMYYAGDEIGLKDGCTSFTIEDKYKFFFTGSHEAMYIHNAATTNKLASVDSWTADGVEWAVAVSPMGGGLAIGPKGGLNSNSCINEKNYATNANTSDFTTWSANDAGSIFVVELASEFAIPETGKFYTIECPLFENVQGVKKGLFVNAEGVLAWETVDLTNKNYYWVPTVNAENNTIVLKNVGTEKYLSGAAVADEPSNATLEVLGSGQFKIVVNDVTIHANGHNSGNGTSGNIVSWNTGINNASAWSFVEQRDPDAAIPVTINYSFTYGGVEKYTQSTTTIVGDEYPAITTAFPFGVSAVKPEGVIPNEGIVDGVITVEIPLTVKLPFVPAADNQSITKWYYIQMHSSPGYGKYLQDMVEYIEWLDPSVDEADRDSYTWAFVGNVFDGFKLLNKKAGTDKAVNSNGEGNPALGDYETAVVWQIKPSRINKDEEHFCFQFPEGNYMNAQSGKIAFWSDADQGSTMWVTERDLTGATELKAFIDQIKANQENYVVGTGVGCLTEASYNDVLAAISAAEAALEGTMTEAISDQHKNAINEAIAKLEINMPSEGVFYTIQNAYSNVYMGVGNTTGMVTSADAALGQVFQFVSCGDGKFNLYNVERGTYLNTALAHANGQNSAAVTSKEDAKAVTIAWLGKQNQVSITPDGGATLHHDANYNTVVAWNAGVDSRSAWKVVEADIAALSHSVTITEAGWATLVLACNATIPADVKAYVVSSVGETSAKLAEITGTIPANEAVLLNAAPGAYEFKYAAEAAPVAENLLLGSVFDTNVALKAYVLSAQGEPAVVGFREAEFNVSTNTENDGEEGAEDDTFEAFKNNAFRAYLLAPAAGARFLSFDFGTETAIESIEGAENGANAVIYDLSGRRVQKAQKGLYIVNGVKVIK